MKYTWLLLAPCLLAGCQRNETDAEKAQQPPVVEKSDTSAAPGYEFAEVAGEMPPLPSELDKMQVQIALERLGFSPGVIDGKGGQSLTLALKGFQNASDLDETGDLDAETTAALSSSPMVPATRRVRIPAAFAQGPFVPDLPEEAADQAKLPALGYRNMMEALAERFHTTPETLVALNSPDTPIGAGRIIIVPNVADAMPPRAEDSERGWDKTLQTLGVAPQQPEVQKVVVDKSEGWLRAYGADDRLIAQFPVTTGSKRDPLPLGTWKVNGVARNPDFNYNPELFWDVSDSEEKVLLKPGPNSPVGVAWIDISKPHYGIHGTGEPSTIGRAESHGCVRLTNWDVAKLAGMVKPGVKVEFQA